MKPELCAPAAAVQLRYRDWSKEVKLKVKRPDLTTTTTAYVLLKTHRPTDCFAQYREKSIYSYIFEVMGFFNILY